MIETWRSFLYPLGFISSLFFAARFVQQWVDSEIQQASRVTRNFWILSFIGNVFLWLHSIIQLQIHICLLQCCNAIISWRNLNLMNPPAQQLKKRTVCFLFLIGIGLSVIIFLIQGKIFGQHLWLRIPRTILLWDNVSSVPSISCGWHIVGTLGILLFSLRFWIQWWDAEQKNSSHLGPLFWWTSLCGGVLSTLYFAYLYDPVNFVGPCLGTLPYIRNLILIYKHRYE